MNAPDQDWFALPQGPPQPPPNVYALLTPEESVPSIDPELVKLVMESYAGAVCPDTGGLSGPAEGRYTLGYSYDGQYEGSMPHGRGRFLWDDGTSFTGTASRHCIEGEGRYTFRNGDTYSGEVQNGVRHGQGMYTVRATGEVYSGAWAHGIKHGQGRLHYTDASYYDGDWVNGARTGQGVMVYPTGSRYSGGWVDSMRQGFGTMTWYQNGREVSKYTGNWQAGRMEGEGTQWFYPEDDRTPVSAPASATTTAAATATAAPPVPDDGSDVGASAVVQRVPSSSTAAATRAGSKSVNYYKGDFVRGQRSGRGTFSYQDGGRYEGMWEDNKKHGHGVFCLDSGVCYEGSFDLDKPTSSMPALDKPALSRYVPVYIDDLLVGERDAAVVVSKIESLLSQHYWELRQLYRHYSTSNLDAETRHSNLTALSLLQFWRMLKETRLSDHGLSLAEADRIFLRHQKNYLSTSEAAPPPPPEPQPLILSPNTLSASSVTMASIRTAAQSTRVAAAPPPGSPLTPLFNDAHSQVSRRTGASKRHSFATPAAAAAGSGGGGSGGGGGAPSAAAAAAAATASAAVTDGSPATATLLGGQREEQGAVLNAVTKKASYNSNASRVKLTRGEGGGAGGLDAGASICKTPSMKCLPPLKTVGNVHAVSGCMYFREFVEAIVRIAFEKYRCYPSMSLCDKVGLCLSNDIKQRDPEDGAAAAGGGVGRGTSTFFKDSEELSSLSRQHAPLLTKLYTSYAQRSYNGLATYRTRPANDVVVTVRQFLTLLKETHVVDKASFPLRKALALFDAPSPHSAMVEATQAAVGAKPSPNFGATNATVTSTGSDETKPGGALNRLALAPYPPPTKDRDRQTKVQMSTPARTQTARTTSFSCSHRERSVQAWGE